MSGISCSFFSSTRPVLKRGSYNAELKRITVHEESSPDSTRRPVPVAMPRRFFGNRTGANSAIFRCRRHGHRSFKGTFGFGVLPVELHRRAERFNQRFKIFAP